MSRRFKLILVSLFAGAALTALTFFVRLSGLHQDTNVCPVGCIAVRGVPFYYYVEHQKDDGDSLYSLCKGVNEDNGQFSGAYIPECPGPGSSDSSSTYVNFRLNPFLADLVVWSAGSFVLFFMSSKSRKKRKAGKKK
jgi:hypothetical protein